MTSDEWMPCWLRGTDPGRELGSHHRTACRLPLVFARYQGYPDTRATAVGRQYRAAQGEGCVLSEVSSGVSVDQTQVRGVCCTVVDQTAVPDPGGMCDAEGRTY